jgi:NAD(P)-dependent dehydrogenase (short-subunit alcohol dehydrogenase family)
VHLDEGLAVTEPAERVGVAHRIELFDEEVTSGVATTKRANALHRCIDGIANGSAPPSKQSVAAMRELFATNVFGLVAVTQAFLPLLERAPAARIVNMSTSLGSSTLSADPDTVVRLATLPEDGPTAGLFNEAGAVPW